MGDMKEIKAYRCKHCDKIFLTQNRHICRKNPNRRNCYSCIHWGHEFVMEIGETESCTPEDACKIGSEYACDAFERMRFAKRNGKSDWVLNCPNWKQKGV